MILSMLKIRPDTNTAWRVSVFEVILVRIFPHLDWIGRDTPYLSVFSPNARKCGPEQLQIRTFFTQWKWTIKLWLCQTFWLKLLKKLFRLKFFSICVIIYVIFTNMLFLKVLSATFLLVCFSSLKESNCETWKNIFYFTSKALFILEKIKF